MMAPPRSHCRASLGAPSFMRRSLLCDRQLLMLNALIRRDKTTLKIHCCRPPAGAKGLPGGRQPGQGGCWEVLKLLVLQVALSRPLWLRQWHGLVCWCSGDWLGLARGLLRLELPYQSQLQTELGLLRLPCLHPAPGTGELP